MAATAWTVTPSGPLRGDVFVRGSKNAVTKHMVAAVLGEGPSVIRRVPEVGDVTITTEILPAPPFYYAEAYHQQYLGKNPGGYCGLGGTGVTCPVGAAL